MAEPNQYDNGHRRHRSSLTDEAGNIMNKPSLILFILIIVFISACANPTSQPSQASEPVPPDPFPVELQTRAAVFEVDTSGQTAALKLQAWVKRNTDLHAQVQVYYTLSGDSAPSNDQQLTLFDGSTEVYVPQILIADIVLTAYGKYQLLVEANYDSWGQQRRYEIEFDKNGVSVVSSF